MKKTANIFTYCFFDFENNIVRIGGAETYTLNLANLLVRMGYETTVYISLDKADNFKETIYNGFKIKEIAKGKSYDCSFQKIYSEKNGEGLYIVMTEELKVYSKDKPNVITIQHGISWDNPAWAYSKRNQKGIRFKFRKFYKCHRYISRFKMTSNMVCVDYNYYNWLRTLDEVPDDMHLTIIPNAASKSISKEEFEKKLESITDLKKSKIVFARRFVKPRGPLMFANAAKRILEKYPSLDITIAGEGELEEQIKDIIAGISNIHMTKYTADKSLEFHKHFDIAVVPTINAEGTSLSLIEAMAAGCMPVSTHVGGLTNIVIDSFNGKLCYPSEDALYETLVELINMDIDEYKKILTNSYNSCIAAFIKSKWEDRWINYINSIIQ